jgi:hypothetical protein
MEEHMSTKKMEEHMSMKRVSKFDRDVNELAKTLDKILQDKKGIETGVVVEAVARFVGGAVISAMPHRDNEEAAMYVYTTAKGTVDALVDGAGQCWKPDHDAPAPKATKAAAGR